MKINLSELTIAKAREHLVAGDFSASGLWDAYQIMIQEKDPTIHAYIETFEMPNNIDELGRDKNLPLGGIPLGIKDNILIAGHKGTAASGILENYSATYDSTVTSLLRSHGAVFLGRTNMDDAAMGSSTESSFYGPTKNPHDNTRVPGGSSGGSAASVSGDMALGAYGSDTGGSIRQPASFCGVVGMKPTYGTVSRYGLIALGTSLDQIGPIGKTVADTELLFDAISKHDPRDAQSIPENQRTFSKKERKVLGIPKDLELSPDVKENFERAVARLQKCGYRTEEVDLPHFKYGLASYYIVMPAEASTNLGRLDGVRFGVRKEGNDLLGLYKKSRGEGFGTEVKRRILLGTFALSSGYFDAYYGTATEVRNLIRQDYRNAFQTVDAIISPTTPTGAFKLGEVQDPLTMYMSDLFTVPANLAGVPAMSVPSGTDANNMPLGLHITTPWFGEKLLFQIGKDFENSGK